jgi:ABC-2 type transport system permease protein
MTDPVTGQVAGRSATGRNIWAIFWREFTSYFLSPTAYVVIFLFTITNGITFFVYTATFRNETRQIDMVIQFLFGFAPFWILLLLIPPILTMRLFSEEKRTGTIEMLMTSPVTDFQVVMGKFAAAQAFFMLIWSTLLLDIFILEVLGNPDWGPVIAFYIGLFSLGMLFNAVGLFASACTRNQLIAAISALSGNLFLFFVQQFRFLFTEDPEGQRFFDFISFHHHFYNEYSRGIVDLRYLVLYLSFTLLILFFSVRVLEARRWR